MKKFTSFLSEAFPPSKNKSAKPGGGQKPPFGKSKSAPPFGKKKNEGDADGGDGDGTDALLAMQQAEQEAAEAEQAAQEAKREEEEAERQQMKKMRLAAEKEVAKSLEGKYNDDDDTVTMYPDMLAFSDFKKDGDKDEDEDDEEDDDEDSDDSDDEQDSDSDDDGDEDSDDDMGDDKPVKKDKKPLKKKTVKKDKKKSKKPVKKEAKKVKGKKPLKEEVNGPYLLWSREVPKGKAVAWQIGRKVGSPVRFELLRNGLMVYMEMTTAEGAESLYQAALQK